MLKSIVFPKLILTAAVALVLTSCQFSINAVEGSGNVVTENRPITGDFDSIEASNGIDVFVEQSDKASITVEADDNLQKDIITKIDNGVLTIKCKYNSFTDVTKKVTVQMPRIEGIEASSGVNLKSINQLHGESIVLNTSSGADMNVSIEFEKATCEASSGSHINVQGKAIRLHAATSSGSDINAGELLSNEVTAEASSGSIIKVHPLVSLDADASSGSSINYNSEPKTVKTNSSSGGNINKE